MHRQTNRTFGLTFAILLGAIALLQWWFAGRAWISVSVAAGLFLIVALGWPTYLLPFNWLWTRAAAAMAAVSNYAILAISFFLVVWPMGGMMRMLGKDPMARGFDAEVASYFVPVVRTADESTFLDLF